MSLDFQIVVRLPDIATRFLKIYCHVSAKITSDLGKSTKEIPLHS